MTYMFFLESTQSVLLFKFKNTADLALMYMYHNKHRI